MWGPEGGHTKGASTVSAQEPQYPLLKVGERLAHLTVQELLGRGEDAEIYRAFHPHHRREVALKVFRTAPTDPKRARACFRQQMQAIIALKHPNIVRVLEADVSEDGRFYVVMELFEGAETLRDAISLHPTGFEREEGLRLFRQIASAVAYAHEQGVVHGHIRPNNVLLASASRPLLTDFDSACLRENLPRSRTPSAAAYLAPEQLRGQEATEYSDIYALGLLLYEMMVGDVPFKGESFDAIADLQLNALPTPPSQIRVDLDMAVERTIARALRKKPQMRFGSVRELLESLEEGVVEGNPYETLTLERDQVFGRAARNRSFERERAADQTADSPASLAPATPKAFSFPALWWIGLVGLALLMALLALLLAR